MDIYDAMFCFTVLMIFFSLFIKYKYGTESSKIIMPENERWLAFLYIAWILVIPFVLYVPGIIQDIFFKALRTIGFLYACYWFIRNFKRITNLFIDKYR